MNQSSQTYKATHKVSLIPPAATPAGGHELWSTPIPCRVQHGIGSPTKPLMANKNHRDYGEFTMVVLNITYALSEHAVAHRLTTARLIASPMKRVEVTVGWC